MTHSESVREVREHTSKIFGFHIEYERPFSFFFTAYKGQKLGKSTK